MRLYIISNAVAYLKARLTDDGCGIHLILDGRRALDAAVSRPKGWKVYVAGAAIGKSAHAHALSLKVFKGARNVEEALAAARDHSHGGSAELC